MQSIHSSDLLGKLCQTSINLLSPANEGVQPANNMGNMTNNVADIVTINTHPMAGLETWVNQVDGYEVAARQEAAQRIRTAYDTQLVSLDLSGLKITSLPGEIAHLEYLEILILDKTAIVVLPTNLPQNLLGLSMTDNVELTALPANLPDSLVTMFLGGCTSLNVLPAHLPDSLTILFLDSCTSLTTLPTVLPTGLSELHLDGCIALTSLPDNISVNTEIIGFKKK